MLNLCPIPDPTPAPPPAPLVTLPPIPDVEEGKSHAACTGNRIKSWSLVCSDRCPMIVSCTGILSVGHLAIFLHSVVLQKQCLFVTACTCTWDCCMCPSSILVKLSTFLPLSALPISASCMCSFYLSPVFPKRREVLKSPVSLYPSPSLSRAAANILPYISVGWEILAT